MKLKFLAVIAVLLSGCSYVYADEQEVRCSTIESCEIEAREGSIEARYTLAEMYESKGEESRKYFAKATIHYAMACEKELDKACERLKLLQQGEQ